MRFLVVALALLIGACALQQTGIKLTFGETGLTYLKDEAVSFVMKEISSLKIPDISGEARTPVGDIEYGLQNIELDGITVPQTQLNVDQGRGLYLTIPDASGGMKLVWHYREKSWPHISDHGTATVQIKNMKIFVEVAIGVDANQRPSIHTENTEIVVGELDVHLSGGASWLYDLFLNIFAGRIRVSVQSELKNAITATVNTKAEALLSTIPVVEKIDDNMEVSLALTGAPTYDKDFFTTMHSGEFYYTPHPTEAPFIAVALPDSANATEMLQVFVADYVLNSAGYVAAQAGLINIVVNADEVPASSPFQLNTTSLKVLLPALYAAYPDDNMQLVIKGNTGPKVVFKPDDVDVDVYVDISVNVVLPNMTITNAFVLSADISLDADFTIVNGNRLAGTIASMTASLNVTSTNIGPVSVMVIGNLVNMMLRLLVVPKVNGYLSAGFPLPIVDGISMTNPKLTFSAGYLEIGTDIQYLPEFADDGVYIPIIS